MTEQERNLFIRRIEIFKDQVSKNIIRESIQLKAKYCWSKDPVLFADRLNGEFVEIEEGTRWGESWDSAWFHLQGEVPASWAGESVAANLDFNGEGMVFGLDGVPVQGITNGSVFAANFSRDIVPLYPSAKGGEQVELWVETAANNLFGLTQDRDPEENCPKRYGYYEGKVNKIRLALIDEEMWQLRMDLLVLLGLLKGLSDKSVRHARILRALCKAADVYGGSPVNASECRGILAGVMAKPANASALETTVVGHAHIDTGWLWPVRETIRKSARTFSSQIRLIERYPEYVFGASQPQHYAFVKEHYPELYQKIKNAVAEGNWECQGGMWVEADCNIISGESMVRQFLHGKNFYMDEFGVDVRNLWIPDVFGYSAAMPQIMKRAGVDFFVTQKISWSQFNKFPYHTFNWRGIDGSSVITHFPPENSYNSVLSSDGLIYGAENFNEKDVLDGFLTLFGVGNGGGGPHEEHLELGRRQNDLEGSVKVKFGKAQDYLDTLPQHADELPKWSGELYLELHRGTLTTQARTKLGNRMLENRLRQTEYLCSFLPVADYPQETIDALWKTLLINQFHDIIPGSSITMVYEQTEKEYADALASCDQMLEAAAGKLLGKDDNAVTLVNCLSHDYNRPVELPAGWEGAIDADGNDVPVQLEGDKAMALATVPANGMATLKKGAGAQASAPGVDLVLENDLVRYEFDASGQISSILDKETGSQVLETGKYGNVLTVYEDRPNNWDAWDVDIFYENQRLLDLSAKKATVLPGASVRQGICFEYEFSGSTMKQNVFLASNSKRVDFESTVDWHEKHSMLRVSFPVNVVSDKASFDIQYGYAERPTHRNTSWDMARFEVAAHKYVDLSDRDYGVALMNNCKYGHKVHENVLDLNLLRSSTYPDPDADQGEQVFTYSLLPHTGTLTESSVMAEAAQLNVQPLSFAGVAGVVEAPCQIAGTGVSMEVLKKAEKGDSLVVRLVETHGRRSSCTVTTAPAYKTMVETDLMEWNDKVAVDCQSSVELTLNPFEIRTYKLKG